MRPCVCHGDDVPKEPSREELIGPDPNSSVLPMVVGWLTEKA